MISLTLSMLLVLLALLFCILHMMGKGNIPLWVSLLLVILERLIAVAVLVGR